MSIRTILYAIAFATAGAVGAAAEPAANPDEDCDDIMDELKKLTERVMAETKGATTPLAACAAGGQILGIVKASREVVAECYADGQGRTDLLAQLDKALKEAETQVGSHCK